MAAFSMEAALDIGLPNALVESISTKIRLLIRQAFGFHSAELLIGLATSPSAGCALSL